MKKLIVIHGNDKERIKGRLSAYKSQAHRKNIQTIEADNHELLRSTPESLFTQESIIFIDATRLTPQKDIDKLQKSLAGSDDIVVLYLFKNAPKSFLGTFEKIDKEEKYDLSWTMYKLFDHFIPGNFKNFYLVYLETLQNNPAEMVFGMFHKQIRDMYWALAEQGSMNYPAWRTGKLKSQASKFGSLKLKSILQGLTQLDLKTKTSEENLEDGFVVLLSQYIA